MTVQVVGLSLGHSIQDLVNLELQDFQADLNTCLDQAFVNQDHKLSDLRKKPPQKYLSQVVC